MAASQPPEGPANGVPPENLGLFAGTKRQRRPSVRLGEIGDQSASASLSFEYRRNRQWKMVDDSKQKNTLKEYLSAKTSKTRPLMNLGNGDCHESLEIDENNAAKAKRGGGGGGAARRVRSNWVSSVEERVEQKLSGEDDTEGFKDFDAVGLESPTKEQSPLLSDKIHGRVVRAGVSESRDPDEVELDEPSDADTRDWKCGTSAERNGRSRFLQDGVGMWLNGLGLSRYASVFELHEVDEEVLPLLTLDDLKDMGINAVGSRRKMYCAVQKLRKSFT